MAGKFGNRWVSGIAAGAVLLLAGGIFSLSCAGVFDGILKKSPADAARAAGVVETADAVRVPMKALDSGKALFLSMESEGRRYHYFALRSADGKYRTALDACDVCYRMNRGYRQEGEQMVCNNCGQKFACDRIGEAKGGCNPHPLRHTEEGGYVNLRRADILAGKEYFARKRQ